MTETDMPAVADMLSRAAAALAPAMQRFARLVRHWYATVYWALPRDIRRTYSYPSSSTIARKQINRAIRTGFQRRRGSNSR